MFVLITDLESILIPEIWPRIANELKIKELLVTTREIPDFERLMKYRLKILRENEISLSDLQGITRRISPFPGAKNFLKRIEKEMEIVIVSDSFYEFSLPIVRKLGSYNFIANNFKIENNRITGCLFRFKGKKDKVVRFFKNLEFLTIGVGDSHNDYSLLKSSDYGILYNPSKDFRLRFPNLPVAKNFRELERLIKLIKKTKSKLTKTS